MGKRQRCPCTSHKDIYGECRNSYIRSALGGDEWSASSSGRFTVNEENLVPIQQKTRWIPQSVWTFGKVSGPPIAQPAAQ